MSKEIQYFGRLEDLQQMIFSKISEIIDYGFSDNFEDKESIESKRVGVAKEASKLILHYESVLQILQIELENDKNQNLGVKLKIFQEKLSHLKVKLRESQLQSYGNEEKWFQRQRVAKYAPQKLEEKQEATREELFRGRSEGGKGEPGKTSKTNKSTQEQILDHNKTITSTLQSTRLLMSSSIMQTELNIDSLDQQTKDLAQLNDKYTDFEALLSRSKNIVKFIEKQDRSDKNRIYLSIGFLLLCIARVLWRRILKLPTKILFWFLVRIFLVCSWFIVKTTLGSSSAIDASSAESMSSAITESLILAATNSVDEGSNLASSTEDIVTETLHTIASETRRILDEL